MMECICGHDIDAHGYEEDDGTIDHDPEGGCQADDCFCTRFEEERR
jgi:hypothetical protein